MNLFTRIQAIELLILDLIEPIVHIYLVDNKKPRNFGRRRGFALKRDKYEAKTYTESNHLYPVPAAHYP